VSPSQPQLLVAIDWSTQIVQREPRKNLAVLYRKVFDVQEEIKQVHLADENMEPTMELGAIGGIVPEISINPSIRLRKPWQRRPRSDNI